MTRRSERRGGGNVREKSPSCWREWELVESMEKVTACENYGMGRGECLEASLVAEKGVGTVSL